MSATGAPNGARPRADLVDEARRRNARVGHSDRAVAHAARQMLDDMQGAPAPSDDHAVPTLLAYPQAVRLLDAPDEPPPAWLVADLIPRGEPVLIAGEGGAMKSTIALHLACAVAAGGRVFEHGAPVEAAPVLVVSGEDPRGVIKNRCAAIAKGHGWSRERVLGHLHVLALVGVDLALPSWRAHLLAEAARTGAALVVLDPLANLASGEENSNTERRPVVETWRAFAAAGTTPVLVHHAGKAGDGSKSKRDRIRGGTAIADASRCTLFLERTDAGVTVENIKQSRAVPAAPFVVVADVAADPQNRAAWTSAKFTRTTQRRAAMTHAAGVLLGLIAARPGRSGNELREAAKVGRDALADALAELQHAGRIRFEPGPRNAQLWHLTDPNATDPDWSRTSPDHSPATDPDWSSLKGEDQSEDRSPRAPFGPLDDEAEARYLADERAGLQEGGEE